LPDSPASTNSKDMPPVGAVKSVGPVHNYQRPDMSPRDHLVMMVMAGAEIEHALMVQYLYAAYSINGEQDTEERQVMVEDWRASILSVAREEMGHLLTVQNLLVLLGAPINLGREMLPWDHEFYPFPFSLEPLSLETLQCFIYAEMPRPDSLATPAPGKKREKVAPLSVGPEDVIAELSERFGAARVRTDMHQVGELYDEIIDLISDPKRIPESAFNEASYDMQASWDDWGRGYKPAPYALDPDGNIDLKAKATSHRHASNRNDPAGRDAHVQVERMATRAQAVKALRALAAQGEAPHLKEDETGEPSHFERFIQIYREFKDIRERDPDWKPTYDIPSNPTTRIDFHNLHPDNTTYISLENHDEVAAHYFAQLFNQRYRLLLVYLAHSFRLARTQPIHQPSLRAMIMHRAFGEMYNLKTIAGLLVRLPRHGGGTAAPPFELPYTLELPQADRDIWIQYDDLIASSYHTCSEIFRLAKVADYSAVREQIASTGGDVYLRTLMNLDTEARRWIGQVLAGTS
jgi:hypothetical protein